MSASRCFGSPKDIDRAIRKFFTNSVRRSNKRRQERHWQRQARREMLELREGLAQ